MPTRVGKLPNQGARAATPACTLNKAAVAVIRSGNPIWPLALPPFGAASSLA